MKKGTKLLLMVFAVFLVLPLIDISYSAYQNDAEYLTEAFYLQRRSLCIFRFGYLF